MSRFVFVIRNSFTHLLILTYIHTHSRNKILVHTKCKIYSALHQIHFIVSSLNGKKNLQHRSVKSQSNKHEQKKKTVFSAYNFENHFVMLIKPLRRSGCNKNYVNEAFWKTVFDCFININALHTKKKNRSYRKNVAVKICGLKWYTLCVIVTDFFFVCKINKYKNPVSIFIVQLKWFLSFVMHFPLKRVYLKRFGFNGVKFPESNHMIEHNMISYH